MAADGTGVAGGGAVGGCLTKDSLQDAKCPAPVPNRRRASSLSRDAQRRAYQWCREYLGGAWRRAQPEELSVCPVRSGVSLGALKTLPVWMLSVLCWGGGGGGGGARIRSADRCAGGSGSPWGLGEVFSREWGLGWGSHPSGPTLAEPDRCGSAAEALATCSSDARYRTTCPVWARSPARCCYDCMGPSCR